MSRPLACAIRSGRSPIKLRVPELKALIFKNQSVTGFALVPVQTRERLRTRHAELFNLAARGQLKVTIDGAYPLDRVGEADGRLEGRETIGKLVLGPCCLATSVKEFIDKCS